MPRPLLLAALLSCLCLLLLAPRAQAYVSLRPPLISSRTTGGVAHPTAAQQQPPPLSRSNVVVSDQGLLIKNYRPLPPSDDDPLDVRCALLHISARKAIKSGKMEVARRFYALFVYKWKGSRSENAIAHTYFLWALLEQRAQDVEKARQLFKEATTRYPTHARLLQAWALFESRYGSLQEARRLIAAAVEHDRSLEPVLKWKLWGAEPFAAEAAA